MREVERATRAFLQLPSNAAAAATPTAYLVPPPRRPLPRNSSLIASTAPPAIAHRYRRTPLRAQAAVPKFAKLAMAPPSGAVLGPGHPPVTQAIRVDNSQQGLKPRE